MNPFTIHRARNAPRPEEPVEMWKTPIAVQLKTKAVQGVFHSSTARILLGKYSLEE